MRKRTTRSIGAVLKRNALFFFIFLGLGVAAAALTAVLILKPDPSASRFKKLVKQNLPNSQAAQFRNVEINLLNDGSKAMCGEVRTKDNSGNYGAYRRVIAKQNLVIAEFTDVYDTSFVQAWMNTCIYHYANPMTASPIETDLPADQ